MASKDLESKVFSFTKKYHNTSYPFISPSRPELSCAGKNIIVTGGGSGIGKAISIGFAQAGAKSVTIIGRDNEKLKKAVTEISSAAHGGPTQVIHQIADITDASQVGAAFNHVVAEVGKIDVLVSNASGDLKPGPLDHVQPNDLSGALQSCVVGPLNLLQAFIPLAGPEPVVLNTSTCCAHWVPLPGTGVYSIAKAAALKLFDSMAQEHPEVHVVSMQPGWVATAINGYQKEATDSAELPGHFFVWLASREASFLKGKFVWANWDAEELVERADEIAGSRQLLWGLEGVPV